MVEETKSIPWLLVLVQNLRIGDKCRMLVFIGFMLGTCVCVVEGFIWFGFGTV